MTGRPRLTLEVAPTLGVTDVPDPGDWVDLSDRITEATITRGRNTELDEFRAGVATLTLDNSDRMLDPTVTGAINELAAGLGLPLCPARVMVDWDGQRWPLLVGNLGEEPWIPDDAPHGATGTVQVDVVDTMARDAGLGLPPDPMRAAMLAANPDWWGRTINWIIDVPDWSRNADPGTYLWGTTPVINQVDPLVPVSGLPGLELHETGIEVPTALAGPVDDFTVFCVARLGSTLQGQVIARKPSTPTSPGWRIRGGPSGGSIDVDFFAPGGGLLHSMSQVAFDDVTRFALIVEGGVEARLQFESIDVRWASGSVPTGWEGRPRFSDPANAVQPALAEMAYWSGTHLNPLIVQALAGVARGGGWIAVPTLADRIAAWQALAGSTTPVQIHPATTPQLAAVEQIPATLADGYRAAAEAGRGAAYALRDGTIRVRTIEALTDPTLTTHYGDPIANLTDEPTPAGVPVPVRRSPVRWSGPRLPEVINVSEVTYRDGLDEAVVSSEDQASIDRFGIRRREFRSDWAAAERAAMQAVADADVARYAWPHRRMDSLTIEPDMCGVLDPDDAIRLVVEDLELERAIDVTWTPPGGSPETVTLNVQGETWSWVGSRWTVTLALAES